MAQIVAQILGVTGRTSRNGQHTMYDVALSDGNKYTTFDADLANRANALVGQTVSADVEVKQNNRNGKTYTNYDLNDLAPQGQLATQPIQAGTPIQVGNGSTPAIPIAPPQNHDADRSVSILKQVSLKVAGGIVASLFQGAGPEAGQEAGDIAVSLAKQFYAALSGAEAEQAVPATPAEVAAAVPGVQVGVQTEPVAAAAGAEKPGVQW